MESNRKTIIGIDPGSRCTGYGIIWIEGSKQGCVTFGQIKTDEADLNIRLGQIHDELSRIIATYQPQLAAIEQVFTFHNHQSALKLGQARGAALVATAQFGLEVTEYSPKQIKQAIVGYGGATKAQIQHMVNLLLKLKNTPSTDAADALAIALCHANSQALTSRLKQLADTGAT